VSQPRKPAPPKASKKSRSKKLVPPSGKGRKLPAEVLTPDEVQGLVQACSPTAPSKVRNQALIAVLYQNKLRVKKTLALYPKDLDPKQNTIQVLHGKNDQARTVTVDPNALALVKQ
jgi:site-specific recombinase XerD